jgi:hypothetical protein
MPSRFRAAESSRNSHLVRVFHCCSVMSEYEQIHSRYCVSLPEFETLILLDPQVFGYETTGNLEPSFESRGS